MKNERDFFAVKKIETVNRIEWIGYLIILLLVLFPVFMSFINEGFWQAVIMFVILFFVFGILIKIFDVVIVSPLRSLWFSRVIKNIKSNLDKYKIQPSLIHHWKLPTLGVFAIDTVKKKIFIESRDVSYYPTVIEPESIVSIKVERESTMRTTTKHGGSFAIFGSSIGYGFGSKSKSKTTVEEQAFLEIQYRDNENTVPTLVVIPFNSDRRKADQAIVTIQNFL